MAFRPASGRTSARSMSSRFSIRSSVSTLQVYRGAADRTYVRMPRRLVAQAAELLTQAVVERGPGGLRQQRLVVVEADLQALARLQRAHPAPVGGHVHRLARASG